MSAFVVVVAAVVAYEAYLLYLDSAAHHRRAATAQAARHRAAHRIRVRVHQPGPRPQIAAGHLHIPWQRLSADDYTVEAAGAAARRDRDLLLTSLGRIGQAAA